MGRSFREALQKAMRSLERGLPGIEPSGREQIELERPHPDRLQDIAEALEVQKLSVDTVAGAYRDRSMVPLRDAGIRCHAQRSPSARSTCSRACQE